jgi:hypothetical protein
MEPQALEVLGVLFCRCAISEQADDLLRRWSRTLYPAGAGLVTLLDAASRTISPPIRYVVEHVPFWRFAFSIRSSLVLFAVRGELSNLD